jgi:hypothetical protein
MKKKRKEKTYLEYIQNKCNAFQDVKSEAIAQEIFFVVLCAEQVASMMAFDFEDDSSLGIFCDSLPGLTQSQEITALAKMVMAAFQACMKGEYGIDRNCQEEWIWCDLIRMAYDTVILPDFVFDDPSSDYGGADDLVGIADVTDGLGVCQIFYPHAISDTIEKYSKLNHKKVLAEFEWMFDDILNAMQFPWRDEIYTAETPPLPAKIEEERLTPKEPFPVRKKTKDKALYLIKCKRTGFYKIGVSNNPKHREATLQAQEPTVEIVGKWDSLGWREAEWHNYFAPQRLRGEWFELTKVQVAYFCNSNTTLINSNAQNPTAEEIELS